VDERAIQAYLFQSAHVNYIAVIEKRVDHVARTRLGTDPEHLDDWELMERYFKAQKVGAGEIPDLLDYAHKLLDDDSLL
jgi:hypothetical protein